MSTSEEINTRLTELELMVTHLQRDLGDLNSVVISQQKQFEHLKSLIERLDHRIGTFDEPAGTNDPASERPPHY